MYLREIDGRVYTEFIWLKTGKKRGAPVKKKVMHFRVPKNAGNFE